MIQPNELRIGNILKEGIVCQIERDCFYVDNPKFGWLKNTTSEINPIVLTEDVMFSFGFSKNNKVGEENIFYLKGEGFEIWLDDKNIYLNDCLMEKEAKYVHDIQNIFFCFREKELTFNK
jgi:hypothetical protein